MKNLFLFILIALFSNVKAQFVFEQEYDSAATYNVANSRGSQLMYIKFESSGERFVKINRAGKAILIYNMNHALLKTISLASLPMGTNVYLGDLLYLSEKLFNTDNLMEFMYIMPFTDNNGNGNYVTSIYNENGLILFSDTAVPFIRPNFAQQQLPIYNTSNGTKMILSKVNGRAKVYGIGGSLSTGIAQSNQDLLISGPYPNPSIQTTTIDYKLPENTNQGEIIFYDSKGARVKSFTVDKTFSALVVSTEDIPAGTYYYQIQTGSETSSGKKLIVIK
jgi:hypothetical protein